jgi:hypothetical protein
MCVASVWRVLSAHPQTFVATLPICLTIAVTVGCGSDSLPEPRSGRRLDRECLPMDSADYYFPPGAIVANNRHGEDDFWRERSSRYLRPIGVSPLWCGSSDQAYRLLLIPSNGSAVVVELREQQIDWTVSGNVFRGPRDTVEGQQLDPFLLKTHTEKRLSHEAVSAFLDAVQSGGLWTAPAYASETTEDGERWILEARNAGLYRVLTRHEVQDEKFERAARLLISLAAIKIPGEMR